MGTRSRWRKGRGSGVGGRELDASKPKSADEISDTPASTSAQPPTPSQGAPTIHKGVYLSALIYIEGDMPAPEDFTSQATSGLKEALGEAFKANPGGLSMTVKKVEVKNDVEQDEGEQKGDDKEAKFQF